MEKYPDNTNFQRLAFDEPPQWAREAIWYQIMVERFRYGNPYNNPTRMTCYNALIDPVPDDWTITAWGNNWYHQETWALHTGLDFYRTVQMRRYGGDLDGVLEKIPYLKELGITAVYFNPLNDAPSLHKYDARYYHHIDITFGNDPDGDMALIQSERPEDSNTWVWTTADLKFLEVVQTLHLHGIRVILDFSWNHTGTNFWAFKDIIENKDASAFKDWYQIEFKVDSVGIEKTLDYKAWAGITSLPEFKKILPELGNSRVHPDGDLYFAVKSHIFEVTRRWMDPYGNGDFSCGIDGMRLDVADHIPFGFWRDFRKFTRSINPEFFLIGECWWEEWPDKLMNPQPWLKGDVFDSVMHYQWYKTARGYFAEPNDNVSLKEFKKQMTNIFNKYPAYTQQAMMNLASSHDSPRLLSAFFNVNKYKFRCKPNEDKNYRTDQPGEMTYKRVRLFLLHQFTFVGAPHIWNGDEMGMTGADDPDNRKPLVWPDIHFELESQSDYSDYQYSYQPEFDKEMFQYYKSLICLRKSDKIFALGDFRMEKVSHNDTVLAYARFNHTSEYWILFNVHSEYNEVRLPFDKGNIIFQIHSDLYAYESTMLMAPYSGVVILRDK